MPEMTALQKAYEAGGFILVVLIAAFLLIYYLLKVLTDKIGDSIKDLKTGLEKLGEDMKEVATTLASNQRASDEGVKKVLKEFSDSMQNLTIAVSVMKEAIRNCPGRKE